MSIFQTIYNHLLNDYKVEVEDQGDGVLRQVVKVAENAAPAPPSGIVAGAKTVASAGTAEKLVASATPCKRVIMTVEDDNTGSKVYYGGASVSSSVGDYLFAAQKITIEIDDVSKIYIDVDTSGDGVKFSYFT